MILQLILSLSILIVLHELGHFTPAKLFGARVEKFYLFFDPWFSLFKVQKGETEYGIGWLPLGGYVKISGMIDESMDKEQMAGPPQPWEFRSKPAWQRLIIMLGGVTVNFILGFLLYGMVLFVWGEEYLPTENVKYGIHADSLGVELGLQTGDKVLTVGETPFEKFNDRLVVREIIINSAETITVERDGRQTDLPVDPKFITELSSSKNKGKALFSARHPFVINEVGDDSPAQKAGLQKGDKVIALNNTPTPFYDQFADIAKTLGGKQVPLQVEREGDGTLDLVITPSEKGRIGVYREPVPYFFDTERQEYTVAEALPAGVAKGWNFLADQVKAFGQIFKGKIAASESLGGFGTIAKMYGTEWNWERFWTMTAVLSLILAFMNLLPIPALDGGHVMFLLWEMITGRKPSDKFLEYATIIGFVIVLSLVVYANVLDFFR